MIIENDYVKECQKNAFSALLKTSNWKPHLKFIHSVIKYPKWHSEIDLLQYVEDLHLLRNDPNTYFIFDASEEGFSPFEKYFFCNLYKSCNTHNIPYEKIIFVSSNLKDRENVIFYNNQNSISQGIHVFTFPSYKHSIQQIVRENYGLEFNESAAYTYYKARCHNDYKGIPAISLSRTNREHRSLANFLLYANNLEKYFQISQSVLTEEEIKYTKQHYPLSKNFDAWNKTLPRIVDTDQFNQNQKINLDLNLHSNSIFQIVNETHVKTWNNTSLFFSEKTFRPIALMQPFLIFGQPGCNKKLEQFGFKLFYDIFDYRFDNIEDTKKRYTAIIKNCNRVLKELEDMSISRQIEWRFKNKEALQHNFSLLMDNNACEIALQNLIKKL